MRRLARPGRAADRARPGLRRADQVSHTPGGIGSPDLVRRPLLTGVYWAENSKLSITGVAR